MTTTKVKKTKKTKALRMAQPVASTRGGGTVDPGYTVVTDISTAGAIIWWRLSGETDLAVLKHGWTHHQLDEKLLPDNPSKTVAMFRAVDQQSTLRRMIRPLPGSKGWAVVDETPQADGTLAYETMASVKLEQDALTFGVDCKLQPQEIAKVRADFDAFQLKLTANDMSSWLSKMVKPMLNAVSLRDTGGVYFVPRDRVEVYHAMSKAIGAASAHKMFEVPALKSTEAVDAILDAVLREADGECVAMETELDAGELKKRALKARAVYCESLREKVESYEALLGRNMSAVRERIENLKASVVAAELSLVAEEGAAA